MKKHERAGRPMQITKGPLKGRYFVVIDYLTNQFQGKDIKKIAKAHPELTRDLEKQKLLDDKIVFGRIYPTMDTCCVHDSQLLVEVESKSEAKRLSIVKGGKDDTTGASTGDSEDAEPGEPGLDGRSVSSDEEYEQVESPYSESEESDSSAGSGEGRSEAEHNPPSEPKAKGGRGPAKRTSKPKGSKS